MAISAPIVESIVSSAPNNIVTFSQTFGSMMKIYLFDGTYSQRTIIHDTGRMVYLVFVQNDGVQVYPHVTHDDLNTVTVSTNVPIIGTLYVV